jgi:RHS repeat-associated protein
VLVSTADLSASAVTGQRVLLTLGDHLGSTSTVIDRETGELVEAVAYTAYGQSESDVRPDRYKGLREDVRFTGNEDDVEVGLTAFVKRYYAPALGRWASPDPLAVHAPGEADLNLYAYVHGRVYAATDPLGLQTLAAGTVVLYGASTDSLIDVQGWISLAESTRQPSSTGSVYTHSALSLGDDQLFSAMGRPGVHVASTGEALQQNMHRNLDFFEPIGGFDTEAARAFARGKIGAGIELPELRLEVGGGVFTTGKYFISTNVYGPNGVCSTVSAGALEAGGIPLDVPRANATTGRPEEAILKSVIAPNDLSNQRSLVHVGGQDPKRAVSFAAPAGRSEVGISYAPTVENQSRLAPMCSGRCS